MSIVVSRNLIMRLINILPILILTQPHAYFVLQVLMHFSEHKVIASNLMFLGLLLSDCTPIHSFPPPTAGVDFSIAGYPLQVTIPAGQTSAQFTVTVIDELIVERDEQFQLTITYSDGQPGVEVITGFDKANITIRNDDGKH